jgi:hypothetical protein
MQLFYDAMTCGILAALTWMGLVWMSPNRPIQSGQAWVQGVGTVATTNIVAWVLLVTLNLRSLPIWAVVFLLINIAIAGLLFPLYEGIQIPKLWALLIHPLVIAIMTVLLSGAVGAI